MIPSSKCPKCDGNGTYIGIYTERHGVDDFTKYDLYECDGCIQIVKLFGEPIEVEYQWIVGVAGKIILVEREDLI